MQKIDIVLCVIYFLFANPKNLTDAWEMGCACALWNKSCSKADVNF